MAETTEKASKAKKADAVPQAEIVISTKGILDMLNRGIDRKGIAKHYGVPQSVIKRLFDTVPSLKGKKTKPTAQFTLLDDAEGGTGVATAPVTSAPVAEAPTQVSAPEVAAQAPTAEPVVQAAPQQAAGQW